MLSPEALESLRELLAADHTPPRLLVEVEDGTHSYASLDADGAVVLEAA